MPKRLSGAVPLLTIATTLAAFVLPWLRLSEHLLGGAPIDPSFVIESALVVLLAMVAIAYLGGVRWRDLERLENAWSVTTRVGLRAMPADRLRASAGWGVSTLFNERYWGRALNAAAASLRWLVPVLAVVNLIAALACLALTAAKMLAPNLLPGLEAAPDWTDALVIVLPALLWLAVRLHLARLPHAEVPSDAQINAAQLELMNRLTDPKLQAGTAAMSAVDHGLDGVFALAQRFSALAPQAAARPAHELAGLSDMPGELVEAGEGR